MASLTNCSYPFSNPAAGAVRTAVLASSDLSFRQRVRDTLTGLRWQVREAAGGAEALAHLDAYPTEALILDSWLPDLEIREFVKEVERRYPGLDLISMDASAETSTRGTGRSPRRHELLHALRAGQDADPAAASSALRSPASSAQARTYSVPAALPDGRPVVPASPILSGLGDSRPGDSRIGASTIDDPGPKASTSPQAAIAEMGTPEFRAAAVHRLPEFIGGNPCMLEVSRRIRLVAPRSTPVLIQGPTGSGKELVAKALHRLSARSSKPWVALNCAAIPEALLEAELFGHTRGAFTGAVQGRVGRIESAHGGTLFLDEIGEMPLALQAKLLRFVECGELQRIGDNEPVTVDVRILAATHQPLGRRAAEGGFRSDLYYRLAVFLIQTPALELHLEDLPLLAEHFLARWGADAPRKQLRRAALDRLLAHDWPGNVRELEHVLERGCILAEDRPEIGLDEIEFDDGARDC